MNSGLNATLVIGVEEARNGTQRLLTLPGGKLVTVVIPAGTPDGYLLYFDGQGNAHDRYYDLAGAPLLTVTVRIEAQSKPVVDTEGYKETVRGVYSTPSPLPGSDRVSPALESTILPLPFDGQNNNEPMFGRIPPPPPPPPLPAPLPPTSRHSTRPIMILVAIGLLVIVAGIIGFGAYQNHVNQVRVAATATAQANATATTSTQVHSTASAVAVATASAVAADETTIAANPYPSYLPGSGTLALYDPLTRSFAWAQNTDASFGGSCQFMGAGYQIREVTANRFFECTTSRTYSNFAFQVQMNIQQGDCGGMTFRDNQAGKNYRFVICQDGSYALFLNQDFSGSHNSTLSQGSVNHTIAQGTIAVAAKASSIGIYYNGQQIVNVNDSTLSNGELGLLAESVGHATEVTYSNAKVWTF